MTIRRITKKEKTTQQINREIGKAAEQEVAKSLAAIPKLVWERIPDTAASIALGGRKLPPRRGDYDGMYNSKYWILEVKYTSQYTEPGQIPIKATWKPGQLAAAWKWGNQGACCISLIYLEKADMWCVANTTLLAREVEAGLNRVKHRELFPQSELTGRLNEVFKTWCK